VAHLDQLGLWHPRDAVVLPLDLVRRLLLLADDAPPVREALENELHCAHLAILGLKT